MKLIVAVTEEKDLAQIPGLLEGAGIQVQPIASVEKRVTICKWADAAGSVVVMKKTRWDQFLAGPILGAGPLREKITCDIERGGNPDFFQAFNFARDGFFRWLFGGAKDRDLQLAIAQALEPIFYVQIDWKG
ncbi:MAG: hypothetical protein KDB01_01385 [Planctomycetaceae bacterium]|nr:hypothetical protein [Planctomycetaceae bacterium]